MINIVFDRPDHTYSPGDVVNLQIIVQVDSEKTFRSIYVRFHGFAHVEWTVSSLDYLYGLYIIKQTAYTAHETYFKNYQTLAGSEEGPMVRLAAGSHVYQASFVLPQQLPESHVGKDGHVRYDVKVHMNVPCNFDEKQTTLFYVTPRFDLNQFQHLREHVCIEAKKNFGCHCWKSDPLYIYNILPHRGFVPGERIQFTLELNNDSDVSIRSAYVKLVEKIVYHARSPTYKFHQYRRILWEHHFTSRNDQLVALMQNKKCSTDLYFDPAWGFRFLDGCGIITVEYYIESEVRASGCYSKLSNYTLIIMGTIPFGPSSPPTAHMFPLTTADDAYAPPIESISEQPLPSYSGAVTNRVVIPTVGIGWPGTNQMETPPPTFAEVQL